LEREACPPLPPFTGPVIFLPASARRATKTRGRTGRLSPRPRSVCGRWGLRWTRAIGRAATTPHALVDLGICSCHLCGVHGSILCPCYLLGLLGRAATTPHALVGLGICSRHLCGVHGSVLCPLYLLGLPGRAATPPHALVGLGICSRHLCGVHGSVLCPLYLLGLLGRGAWWLLNSAGGF
jgi:hypothetical protein